MAYTALYRKYRPGTFEDVKGQEHIVKTLRNQVKNGKVAHAYLFTGTRGTGKTTVAKLLAKAVNCENLQDGSPCEKCSSCLAISRGTAMNVVEMDAASNNGIDDIRFIKESVRYAPSEGKYMVYIIDEAHNLSRQAFNALLKTLEEPPEYVIFILATTEPLSIIETIRSRCQRYDFKRISQSTIADRLRYILDAEGIDATDEAVDYVAGVADGSMRDGLSILDRCIAMSLGETLTYDRILNTIGTVDTKIYIDMSKAFLRDDAETVLADVQTVSEEGASLQSFVENFIWFFRNMLFMKLSPAMEKRIEMTEEAKKSLKELSEQYTSGMIDRNLRVLMETASKMKYSSIKRVTLEMGLIRLMHPEMEMESSDASVRMDKIELEIKNLKEKGIVVAADHVNSNGNANLNSSSNGNMNSNADMSAVGNSDFNNNSASGDNADSDDGQTHLFINSEEALQLVKERRQTEEVYRQNREIGASKRSEYEEANLQDLQRLAENWDSEIQKLDSDLERMGAACFVPYVNDSDADDPGYEPKLTFVVAKEFGNSPPMSFKFFMDKKERFEDALSDLIGKKVHIDKIMQNDADMGEFLKNNTPLKSLSSKIKNIKIEEE